MNNASIPQLTFTRFIAASAVVLFHYGKNAFPFRHGFLHDLASEAGITVSYFFFLSGFILWHVYGNERLNTRKFFTARFARIVPLYMAAFIFSLLLILFLLDQKPYGGSAFLQFFFLQAWAPGHALAINYPAWSVSVEVFFYCCFPLLFLIATKTGNKQFVLLAIIFWILSIGQYYFIQKSFYDPGNRESGDFIMYFPLWHLNTFVSGIAACMLFRRFSSGKFAKSKSPVIMAIAGLCGLIAFITIPHELRPIMHNGMLAPLYAMVVVGLAWDRTIVSRILGRRIPVYLGEISYGIYLLQFPVWVLWEKWSASMGINGASTIGFYGGFLLLLVTSSTFYHVIEKPSRKRLRVLLQRKGEKV